MRRKGTRSELPIRCTATRAGACALFAWAFLARSPKVKLLSDGEGNWSTYDGQTVAYLEGCEYVDIAETPFTNTLPIRRLGLAPGEPADISVAYFDGTELQPWPEPQRYTCLEKSARGRLYRFLSLDGGFQADLPVDADGLVIDYPGLFKRIPP